MQYLLPHVRSETQVRENLEVTESLFLDASSRLFNRDNKKTQSVGVSCNIKECEISQT